MQFLLFGLLLLFLGLVLTVATLFWLFKLYKQFRYLQIHILRKVKLNNNSNFQNLLSTDFGLSLGGWQTAVRLGLTCFCLVLWNYLNKCYWVFNMSKLWIIHYSFFHDISHYETDLFLQRIQCIHVVVLTQIMLYNIHNAREPSNIHSFSETLTRVVFLHLTDKSPFKDFFKLCWWL